MIAGPPSPCPVDIIFVVDESGSVGEDNYEKMKTFLSDLVGGMDIDSGQTRVGLVPFSGDVDSEEAFNLTTYSSVTEVQTAVNSLDYSGGDTETDVALAYVRTNMLTETAGDRPDVLSVVVVLTDGHSSAPHLTEVCTLIFDDTTSLFQKLC